MQLMGVLRYVFLQLQEIMSLKLTRSWTSR